ncbi:MAG: hypothetical protein KIT44_13645 [Opitutaceae bacterium]|nr:hypothetical protein [Opitutaceae bacterium]
MAGSTLGPAGAVVGGIFGGVVGAFYGRWITDRIKQRRLREAIDRLELAHRRFSAASDEAWREWKDHKEREMRRCSSEISHVATKAKAVMGLLIEQHTNAERELLEIKTGEAEALIKAAMESLAGRRHDLVLQLSQRPFWRRWIWPDITVLGLDQAIETLDAAAVTFRRWQDRIHIDGGINRAEVYAMLGALGLVVTEVQGSLIRLERTRISRAKHRNKRHRQLLKEVLAARRSALQRFEQTAKASLEAAQAKLRKPLSEISDTLAEVQREKAKLG